MTLKQIFKDFITNVSFHGISRVFYPNGTQSVCKSFRWVWLVTWVVAFILMIYQMRAMFEEYYQYKSFSTVRIRDEGGVEFPAVTICAPALSKKKIRSFNGSSPLCMSKMPPKSGFQKHKADKRFTHNLMKNCPHIASIVTVDMADFVDAFHVQTKASEEHENQMGEFLTKNWEFDQYVLYRGYFLRKCFSFNVNGNHRQYSTDPFGGISLVLKKDKSHCLREKAKYCGCVKVILHAAGTLAAIDEGIDVCKDTALVFQLEERKNLPAPHGNCIRGEMNSPYGCTLGTRNYTFSKTACRQEKSKIYQISGAENEKLKCGKKTIGDKSAWKSCPNECHQRIYEINQEASTDEEEILDVREKWN